MEKNNRHLSLKKEKQKDMLSEIDNLNKKLSSYESTISILEDKIVVLNLNLKKQSYLSKFSQGKVKDE